MIQTLFSVLLEVYRNKATHAFQIIQNGRNSGHLYIQEGVPLSCYYLEFQGVEALQVLYQEQRLGMDLIELEELDCLAIYSENIIEHNFEKLILGILEKQKLRKVYASYSLGEKQTVSYWQ